MVQGSWTGYSSNLARTRFERDALTFRNRKLVRRGSACANAGRAHHVRVLQHLLLRCALRATESGRIGRQALHDMQLPCTGVLTLSIRHVKRTRLTVASPYASYC